MTETSERGSVAVVDDESGMIRAYELLFRRRNIPVAFFARTGEEGLEMFRRASPRPKIVIIDFRLPEMDGLTLMSEIRSIAPDIKIIMISGDTTVGQKSLNSGAVAFFKKPTSIKDISETINKLLGE